MLWTEIFRKTHEKITKEHFTGKIGDDHDKEEAKSKAEKSWMLWKQLETDVYTFNLTITICFYLSRAK